MNTQDAKQLLGLNTDSELAKELQITRQAVYYWKGNVPKKWQRWVLLLAEKEKPAD